MRTPIRQLLVPIILMALSAGTAAAERWIIPAGAHATGAQDTNWRTDVYLFNPYSTDITVTVYLLRKGIDNSDLNESSTHTVPADGQTVLADVFFSEFGFSGTGGLLVECDNPDLVVNSRTYDLLEDSRTFGLYMPAVRTSAALASGQQGEIIHLAKSADYRSNVGYTAASADGGTFIVRLFDENGAQTGTLSRSFAGFEHWQFNDIFSKTGAPPSTAARAEVEATAPIVAYATVIDEHTGDPVAIMAQRIADAAFEAAAIPGSARAAGANGSLWRTDVRIYNPNTEAATVTLDYYRKKKTDGPHSSANFSVDGGGILALDDAMMEAFGLSSANGAIRVSSDMAVMTWSRTYDRTENGTFGQSVPAVSADFTLGDQEQLIYTGLSNTGYRSNVGFFNLENKQTSFIVFLYEQSGLTGQSRFFTLGPNEMNQVNDVFAWMGVTDANGTYSLVIYLSSGDKVASFVTVIDNLSNDPVYQPGEVRAIHGSESKEQAR